MHLLSYIGNTSDGGGGGGNLGFIQWERYTYHSNLRTILPMPNRLISILSIVAYHYCSKIKCLFGWWWWCWDRHLRITHVGQAQHPHIVLNLLLVAVILAKFSFDFLGRWWSIMQIHDFHFHGNTPFFGLSSTHTTLDSIVRTLSMLCGKKDLDKRLTAGKGNVS